MHGLWTFQSTTTKFDDFSITAASSDVSTAISGSASTGGQTAPSVSNTVAL
jgi:hypothetical protein